MHRLVVRTFIFTVSMTVAAVGPLPRMSHAEGPRGAQICSVGSAAVGQPGALVCKDVLTGVTTQLIPLHATVAAAGAIGGSLVARGSRVLVTNQVGGALLFKQADGYLRAPVVLRTDGEGSLSGALGAHGAYVLTGTLVRFFPDDKTVASSSQPLLRADGTASQVTLTNGYAYVAEKSGSLESFALARDGNLTGPATPVVGVSAGVIVGIAGFADGVVAPIAHLASNANEAEISVVAGLEQVQRVPTKEVAACWTANDGGEACVSNPGSMTVSCGRLGPGGFESFTSAAASPGKSIFDLDVRDDLVGIQAVDDGGAPILLTYRRSNHGDFLTLIRQLPIASAQAAGALLLGSISK